MEYGIESRLRGSLPAMRERRFMGGWHFTSTRSLFQGLVLSALGIVIPVETLACDLAEKKPWRDEMCAFWIPSETSTPTGYVIKSASGERLVGTIFWNDYWDPTWREDEYAFVHSVDCQFLAIDNPPDATEINLIFETMLAMVYEIQRGEWIDQPVAWKHNDGGPCSGLKAQNAALYDEVLRRVKEIYPVSRVVDIYVVKKWISVNWW